MTAPQRVFKHYISGRSLFLGFGDAAILAASMWIALLSSMVRFDSLREVTAFIPQITLLAIVGLVTFYVADLYEYRFHTQRKEVAVRGALAGLVWGILAAALAFSVPGFPPRRLPLFLGVLVGTVGVIAFRWILSLRPAQRTLRERVLFLGATPLAERVITELEVNNPGYEILGYIDDRPPNSVPLTNGFKVLGTTRHLTDIANREKAGTIVVALAERRGTFPMQAVLDCKLQGIRVEDWPTFYEKLTGKILVQDLRPSWLVFSEGFNRTRLTRLIKRLVDVTLSGAMLAFGWPLLALVAIGIKLSSPGPILFRQERVGEGGRVFKLLKFRTMVNDAESQTGPVWATDDDPRITRFGRFLRKTRLDEIPQIINVLKGEMSFIGPRPERPHFVAQLQERIPYYSQRHSIKPGITGWAQVRYRYGASIEDAEEKLQYDLYYVKNMSIFLDLLILLSSIQVVLFGKGAR